MKRNHIKAIVILLSVMVLFASCGTKKQEPPANATTQVSYNTYGNGSNELVYDKATGIETESTADTLDYGTWAPDETRSNYIPWTGDIASLAKADGTLRFYFMAGEGVWTSDTSEKIGDGCIVFFPNGEVMLIDSNTDGAGSGYSGYTPTLMANLRRLGVTKIDYYVQSHGHSDHYGGFVSSKGIAANGIKVGHVYINGTTDNNNLTKACDKYGIPYSTLNEGDTLDIGGVHIDIYNPTVDTEGQAAPVYEGDTSSGPQNNVSIVMKFTYQGIKVLFDGDLYKAGMERVASRYSDDELDADLMKICHHGHSETSISSLYVSKVSPKYAAISSGVVINCDVYSLYSRAGATVKCDYNDGYMIFAIKDNKIYTKTSRVNITDYYDVYQKSASAGEEQAPSKAEKAKYPKGSVHVDNFYALYSAINGDAQYIVLDNDIDISGADNLFVGLDATGKTIDLAGYGIRGIACTDIGGNSDGGEQSCNCTFNLCGDNFTLKNGQLYLGSSKGGYALEINTENDKSNAYGLKLKHEGIVIQDVEVVNAGIIMHGSSVTLDNCKATQPRTALYSNDVATVVVSFSQCTLIGGEYNNFETLSNGGYLRWIKVYNGQAWATNGLKHNALSSHYQYVTHSMFYVERSQLVI